MRPSREPSSRGSAAAAAAAVRCCFSEHATHFRLVGGSAPYTIASRGTHGTKADLACVDFLDRRGVAAVEDGAADRIVHRDELGNGNATLVTSVRRALRRLPSPGL